VRLNPCNTQSPVALGPCEIYSERMPLSGQGRFLLRIAAIIGLLIMTAIASAPAIGWFKP